MRRRRAFVLAVLVLLLLVGGGTLFVALDDPGAGRPVDAAALPDDTHADRDGEDAAETPSGVERPGRSRRDRERVEPGAERGPGHVPPEPEAHSAGGDDERGPDDSETKPDPGRERPGSGPKVRSKDTGARAVTSRAAGRVVDAETDEPIAGARIRFAIMEGRIPRNSWGATSAEDGTFSVTAKDRGERAKLPMELIVDYPGYHIGRMGSPGEEEVIRLERRTVPEVPGTIVGTVTDHQGRPVVGPVLVKGTGEFGSWTSQWVLADEGGNYRMEGVPPRHWRLWAGPLTNREQMRTVLVQPSAETTLALVGSGGGSTGGQGERREVIVSGLPDGARDGATLRAEVKPRLFWRTVTADGSARLELPAGEWTLVLSWGIDQELRRPLTIAAGSDEVTVDMQAPLPEEKRAVVERGE